MACERLGTYILPGTVVRQGRSPLENMQALGCSTAVQAPLSWETRQEVGCVLQTVSAAGGNVGSVVWPLPVFVCTAGVNGEYAQL